MFAHRRVASTANLGSGRAQFDDAIDEIDEDLEDRDESPEIMDPGEEIDDIELVNEDRRADVEGAYGVGGSFFH